MKNVNNDSKISNLINIINKGIALLKSLGETLKITDQKKLSEALSENLKDFNLTDESITDQLNKLSEQNLTDLNDFINKFDKILDSIKEKIKESKELLDTTKEEDNINLNKKIVTQKLKKLIERLNTFMEKEINPNK